MNKQGLVRLRARPFYQQGMINMKIGYMAGHACVRVQKMALPMMQRGHTIYMCSQKMPTFADSYDMYTQAFSLHQLRSWVKVMAGQVDMFHCHNEPTWFVTLCKESAPDVPVIVDIHDSFLTRVTDEEHKKALEDGDDVLRISVEERNNFHLADALVFPSMPFAEIVIKEYSLQEKPWIVMPSYVPRNLFAYQLNLDWHGGVVYQGRCDLPADINDPKKKYYKRGFRYTDMSDFAGQARALGLQFYIYSRDDDKFVKHYENLAALHPPVPYTELMGKIARHDWGLVGNSFYTPQWEIAEPNKLYEYIAAGVPPVVMYADNSAGIVSEHAIGMVVESVKELKERWGEHKEFRKRLLKCREMFMMENHIEDLETFYKEVLS